MNIMNTKILLVDDNPMYRRALRRNLELRRYEVYEAEDSISAMQSMAENQPDILVTDLDMRSRTEGLDLIQQVRQNYPIVPVILISAVGTFDEGAMAKEYGAMYVVSKGQFGQESESLPDLLEQAIERRKINEEYMNLLDIWRESPDTEKTEELLNKVGLIMENERIADYVKSEAFDILYELRRNVMVNESRNAIEELREKTQSQARLLEDKINIVLNRFSGLQEDSLDSLRTAEFLYRYQESIPEMYDFSRNIGFSYCFAVENEVKAKFRHKIPKFLKSSSTHELVKKMYDNRLKNLDLFFQQQLIRLQQIKKLDFQVDKIKQILEKLLYHGERYKPDGLRAMGILTLCFGRFYEMVYIGGKVEINNPLGLKGLPDEEDVLKLAHQLILLQHFRNPYIHPEITVREKVAIIREATLVCLDYVGRLEE